MIMHIYKLYVYQKLNMCLMDENTNICIVSLVFVRTKTNVQLYVKVTATMQHDIDWNWQLSLEVDILVYESALT